jgi:predicted metallo-beta-lactamase superfamily hydrolase
MRVMPLAADSLGVRSMATYVEAGSLRLLLDPGAALAPSRYGLPPTPEEDAALARAVARIETYATRAEAVTVSHYHGDHVRREPALFAGRRVWAKDPRRMIDAHQGVQGRTFWTVIAPHARLEPAEGRTVELGDAVIRISPPLPHGPEGSSFGYVVAVTVDDGTRFVHAADVLGPASSVSTAYLIRERPDLLYLSGPPTYLETQIGRDVIRRGLANLLRLVNETGCRVIVDHHAVRDRRFRERLAPAFETGRVVTAAEYLGQPEQCLETRRPQYWARARRGAKAARAPRTPFHEEGLS